MNLREIIHQVLAEKLPVQTIAGKVVATDRARATIDVQPLEGSAPEMFDVRLRAVDDGSGRGFIVWPKADSLVLVSLIDNELNTAWVSAVSEVETFTLSTADESLLAFIQDWITAIKNLKLATPGGPSMEVINIQDFLDLELRLPKLFSA